MTYLLATWSAPVQVAMHLNWGRLQDVRLLDTNNLLHQATCNISGEILEIHPLSFHVRLNANDLDEPTYKEVSQCNAIKLG